jgi:hypothetical protein
VEGGWKRARGGQLKMERERERKRDRLRQISGEDLQK